MTPINTLQQHKHCAAQTHNQQAEDGNTKGFAGWHRDIISEEAADYETRNRAKVERIIKHIAALELGLSALDMECIASGIVRSQYAHSRNFDCGSTSKSYQTRGIFPFDPEQVSTDEYFAHCYD